MTGWIDLRSDTVTQPTPAMREAMKHAPVGDDVFGDDPSVNKLEEVAAARMGKEAALFVPTGCMGNLLAVMTHTRPGDEIITGQGCHIVAHEVNSAARLANVSYASASRADGSVHAEDIPALVRPLNDAYGAKTALVCLENALGNGRVVELETMQATYTAAKAQGLPVHLDGARIFNAATALGVDARELAACADTVMFCVSKGLCAPVGSLLCGTKEFIRAARLGRKMLGGGMRQAGVLAACGVLAIDMMATRLHEDHANCQKLAALLGDMDGIEVAWDRLDINMLFWRPTSPHFDDETFVAHMAGANIKILGKSGGEYRFVLHRDVSTEDLPAVAAAVEGYLQTVR